MTFDLTTFDGACGLVRDSLYKTAQRMAAAGQFSTFAVVFATEYRGASFPAPLAIGVTLDSGFSDRSAPAFGLLVQQAVELTKALGTVLIARSFVKVETDGPEGMVYGHGLTDAAPDGTQEVILFHLEHGKETRLFFAPIVRSDNVVTLGPLEEHEMRDSVGLLLNLMGRKRAEA